MNNLRKNYIPIWREIGKYSNNVRNLDKEFYEYQEPDPDDPEIWLKEERNDPDFIKSVEERLQKLLKGNDFKDTLFFFGGQSHIDVAWRWRYWQTLRKVIVTYKKAIYHINNLPNFTFVSSQPVLLEWILNEDPDLFKQIQNAVKTNRFDLCGGMYVEPDCHLPSGESFVRQRLFGQHFYLKYFGKLSEVEWVPDSFGYANTLPQIFLKSGTPYFMTTKLTNNKNTPFPFINYLWESPDGSQILSYMNPGGYGTFTQHQLTKNRRRLVKPNEKLEADYTIDKPEASDLLSNDIPEIAAFIGKGDGGHGPTGEEVAMMDYISNKLGVQWITATEYFKNYLEKYRHRLPIWKDEMYYEFHRGTLTTQDLVKRMNRYFEWRLCTLESFIRIISWVLERNIEEINEPINKVWKLTLLNQFHDVLPGSSIPEVYDDCYDIWSYNKEVLDGIEKEVFNEIKGGNMGESNNPNILIFNGTGHDMYNAPLEIPWDSTNIPKSLLCEGDLTNVQYIPADAFDLDELFVKRPNRLLLSISIPQHSFISLNVAEQKVVPTVSSIQEVDGNKIKIDSKYYMVIINKEDGSIESIYCKDIQKEILKAPGIILQGFYDWLPDEPCWNILPTYRSLPLPMSKPLSVEISEKGPVRFSVDVKREYNNEESEEPSNKKSLFIQRISLMNDSPGIFLEFFIDWHTCDTTVKLDIYTTTDAEYTVAESPYGTSKRRTNPTAYHDKPRWENYCQTWVDLISKDEKWGLAILNNGKYGFDAQGSRIGLTMIRGPKYPTPSNESWVRLERSERLKKTGEQEPSHADMGTHLIRYILMPHKGDWKNPEPNFQAFAHWFNEGYICHTFNNLKIPIDSLINKRFIWTEDENIEIVVLKSSFVDKGVIIRINETKMKESECTIHFNPALKIDQLIETDLLERPLTSTDIKIEKSGDYIRKIKVHIKPHEIKTFKI